MKFQEEYSLFSPKVMNSKGKYVNTPNPLYKNFIVDEYVEGYSMELNDPSGQYEKFEVKKGSSFTLGLTKKAKVVSDVFILRNGSEIIINNNGSIDNFEVKSVNMGLNTKMKMILPQEGEFICERNDKGELLFSQKIQGPIVNFRQSNLLTYSP